MRTTIFSISLLLCLGINAFVANGQNDYKIYKSNTAISSISADITDSVTVNPSDKTIRFALDYIDGITIAPTHASLKGTHYHLLWLDPVSKAKLAGRIDGDYVPQCVSDCPIGITSWANSYVPAPCFDKNFYGEYSPWISFKVGNNGAWSAAGIWINGSDYDFSGLDASYTLHLALKNTTDASVEFRFNNGTENVGFTIGSTLIESFAPIVDYTRNGEWQEIEIPMSELITRGFTWNAPHAAGDICVMLGGPTENNPVEIDAFFFYKKAE
jgi:hypothetical protein